VEARGAKMKCRLTEPGKDLFVGLAVLVATVATATVISLGLGWLQLHVFGMNIVPKKPSHSAFEYYLNTGAMVLAIIVIVLIALAFAFMVATKNMPKIFTCKEDENER
jgi:DMSO/TMAO reductase YedYZ heme-binding membrane subunit